MGPPSTKFKHSYFKGCESEAKVNSAAVTSISETNDDKLRMEFEHDMRTLKSEVEQLIDTRVQELRAKVEGRMGHV